jgi:hypothetical protein
VASIARAIVVACSGRRRDGLPRRAIDSIRARDETWYPAPSPVRLNKAAPAPAPSRSPLAGAPASVADG